MTKQTIPTWVTTTIMDLSKLVNNVLAAKLKNGNKLLTRATLSGCRESFPPQNLYVLEFEN